MNDEALNCAASSYLPVGLRPSFVLGLFLYQVAVAGEVQRNCIDFRGIEDHRDLLTKAFRDPGARPGHAL